jgi:hypothetical protein
MDAPTLSAFAAAAAAVAATAVAGINLYIGHRQSKAAILSAHAAIKTADSVGHRRIAEFRQEWIENVRDTLSEYLSLLILVTGEDPLTQEDHKRLLALRTKLQLLLNPDEDHTKALMKVLDDIQAEHTVGSRVTKSSEAVMTAIDLLKAEWIRLQKELH